MTHEGGFALWPSNHTNYSVARSPWRGGQGDVVADFVGSCARHNIRPCFYMAPPHMGNLMLQKLSPDEYMARVNGMLEELLTNYGSIHVRAAQPPSASAAAATLSKFLTPTHCWHAASGCGGITGAAHSRVERTTTRRSMRISSRRSAGCSHRLSSCQDLTVASPMWARSILEFTHCGTQWMCRLPRPAAYSSATRTPAASPAQSIRPGRRGCLSNLTARSRAVRSARTTGGFGRAHRNRTAKAASHISLPGSSTLSTCEQWAAAST